MVRYMYIITVLLIHQRFLHLKLFFKLSFVYILILFITCFHMPNVFDYLLLLLNMAEMAHDWFNKRILFYSILLHLFLFHLFGLIGWLQRSMRQFEWFIFYGN